ncbi:PH domain-containing protein [Arcanobacterium phocisimile]|uniref:PH domain-containing protein n=1 Tax=Arcanobacterium phocisimile TaxID=1302235 RepID=A0ABX7IJZ0_9ACTO|nr:PH domain-containing protein [Arcanobacterium phocisimile]QRV02420.1 PH domain-containing protein [Arcanobacterium phocisimile]
MRNRLLVDTEFQPVDPAFVKVTFIRHIIWWILVGISVGTAFYFFVDDVSSWFGIMSMIVVGGVTAGAMWDMWLAVRRAQALGYVELEDELLIRKGIMFQEVTMVPYGRMQQVNLGTGPLLNAYGLASVELITASAGSDASIPGLPLAEAERLREKLTRMGQAKLEGL